MTLDKAIAILSASAYSGVTTFNDDFKEAQRLAIEALKQLYANRHSAWPNRADILPGETEE